MAHGSGRIYYAKKEGAFVELPRRIRGFSEGKSKHVLTVKHRPQKKLKVSEDAPGLNDASVCFYGQKADHWLSVADQSKFSAKMQEIKNITRAQKEIKAPVPAFRIYNLGGNPMLAKIADGTVDAVFRTKYSEPHDFIPGAHIAMKAGAVARNLNGQPLSLEDFLLDQSRRDGYVVASSERLAADLVQIIT